LFTESFIFLPEEPEVNISVFESVWYFDRKPLLSTKEECLLLKAFSRVYCIDDKWKVVSIGCKSGTFICNLVNFNDRTPESIQ